MKQLDPDSSDPPYVQIMHALTEAIRAGEYGPGRRIPSQVRLQDHFGVAHATINRAVGQLQDEGILVGRQGAGVFVTSNALVLLDTGTRGRVSRTEWNALLARVARLEGLTTEPPPHVS